MNNSNELAAASAGIATLKEFTNIENATKEHEQFKKYGLSVDEIKLYNEFKLGKSYLEERHKNIETSALDGKLNDIFKKVLDSQKHIECEESDCTDEDQKLTFIIDPSFQAKKKYFDRKSISIDHPINHLEELKDNLFGHLDVNNLPSVNKRRKLARRMDRKFSKNIPIPEPTLLIEQLGNNTNHQDPSQSFHDFIKAGSSRQIAFMQAEIRNPNSKWDIKDSSLSPNKSNNLDSNKHSVDNLLIPNKIGCSLNTLYTIKDSKIVRLELRNEQNKSNNVKNVKKSNAMINEYKVVDIKLPINKAEERLLEGTKLSLKDIKEIPRFENYHPGEPSKILFLKNMANSIDIEDLKKLFYQYDIDTGIRLMTGKMKGQGFITFKTLEIAIKALKNVNGTIINGKPIIIQFGKKGND